MNTGNEIVHKMDNDAYAIFRLKGEHNAVKVRRILQLTKDLTQCNFNELRILDLGCAEGLYSIEAALRGANVIAIDGRAERMEQGRSIIKKGGLSNINFLQQDIRGVSKEKMGEFDIIYFLGLLYHLDSFDVFMVMPKLYDMCKRFMIIDTQISLESKDTVFNDDIKYYGIKVREHQENDSSETIQSRFSSSLGNIFSFHFTKESLLRLLRKTGFTTILECYVPFERTYEKMKGNRITLVAIKGEAVKISSYPWLNDMSEEQIRERMMERRIWRPYWLSSAKEACHLKAKSKKPKC